jgi:putative transposase
MPRPLRIEFANAWYHVMNRGANRQEIFKSNSDRNLFLSILSEISDRFNIEIHAFCLMGNHYHLLVKTPHGNLSRAMRHLDGVYTQRYNRLMHRDGPLFRGRYKAILVDSDQYLLQVSRYIHLNPVVAELCENPADYKWSSFRAYVNPELSISWLKTAFTLNQMAREAKETFLS